jgi:hypothetical protein
MKENLIQRLTDISDIAIDTLRNYEIRGVFRLIEYGPAGRKCEYKEEEIKKYPIENLFGEILIACPKGDRTNGKSIIEISNRDRKIIMLDENASSINASILQKEFQKKEYYFSIELK